MRTVHQCLHQLNMSILLLCCLALAACSGPAAPATPAPTEAIAAVATSAPPTTTPVPPTATPQPTDTPVPPTATLRPTDTPVPPTATPRPTNTPVPPTATPKPTATPTPAATPTLLPPPATPTPAVSPAQAHVEQGFDYLDQEQWDKAITEFQAAIELDPEFGWAYLGLGYGYAFGPGDCGQALKSLQTFLRLVPDAKDRAEIEKDIQKLQECVAAAPSFPVPTPPPGKAVFYFVNYTGEVWNVDIGPYFLEAAPTHLGQEYQVSSVIVDPGTYTWMAHSADSGEYIVDSSNNKAFEFTVAAGEAYGTQCCRDY